MQTEYFIRTQSDPRTHVWGWRIHYPGVALFRDGCWGLTLAEAEALLASKTKVKVNP